jgi:flagellar biosynthesis/type III secretory pathway protein FliH
MPTATAPARFDLPKLYVTRLLFQHRWKPRRIMVLFDVVNWMMVLPESHQRRYWRAVSRLRKEREMKLLNPLEQMFLDDGVKIGLQKGLKKGRQEGLEQGRALGAVALLERQLTQRFGPLPQTVREKLEKASVTQVEAWSDALAKAQSLRQVFSFPQ